MVKHDIRVIDYKGHKIEVDICKSTIEEYLEDDFKANIDSAVSEKALMRIREANHKKIFNNIYGYGKHYYDFDSKDDKSSFIKNNKIRKGNDYFIVIYIDIEIDESTNDLAETIDNKKIINSTISFVLENAII